MKKLLFIALIALASCSNGEYQDVKDTTDIMLIAEKDSVKVYRAYYGRGVCIYFTNKGGVAIY